LSRTDDSVCLRGGAEKLRLLPWRGHSAYFGIRHSRRTFGSLLIRDGASLAYVKDQMGRSSIQATVDTYGHLVPGADIAWVDRLDLKTTPQQNATPAQLAVRSETEIPPEVVESSGGPTWIRTRNQQIMSLLL
jgi:hypothetical protein